MGGNGKTGARTTQPCPRRKIIVLVVDEITKEALDGVAVALYDDEKDEDASLLLQGFTNANGRVEFTAANLNNHPEVSSFRVVATLGRHHKEDDGYSHIGVDKLELGKACQAGMEAKEHAVACVFKAHRQVDVDIDVAIIGAGAAGLAAAYHLCESGLKVTLIEARDRMGGRAYTSHDLKVPFDEGCRWMHRSDTAEHPWLNIHELLTEEGVYNGSLNPDVTRPMVVFAEEKLSVSAGRVLADVSNCLLQEMLHKTKYSENLAKRTVKNVVGSTGFSLDLMLKMGESMQGELDESISFRQFSFVDKKRHEDAEYAGEVSGRSGDNEVFEGGYGQLVMDFGKWLTKKYYGLLKFEKGCPVFNVVYDTGQGLPVCLTTKKGKIYARSVIVTVPSSIIIEKRLTFTPGLSREIREAYESLPMGNFKKILLKFDNDIGALLGIQSLIDEDSLALAQADASLKIAAAGVAIKRAAEGGVTPASLAGSEAIDSVKAYNQAAASVVNVINTAVAAYDADADADDTAVDDALGTAANAANTADNIMAASLAALATAAANIAKANPADAAAALEARKANARAKIASKMLAGKVGNINKEYGEYKNKIKEIREAANAARSGGDESVDVYVDDQSGGVWRLIVNEPEENYITAIVGGAFADTLDKESDSQIKQRLKGLLNDMADENNTVPDFEVAVTTWGTDPYSRGSYSYCKPGHENARDILADAVVGDHLIVFAGEATYGDAYATAHGAYSSGIAAAEKLIEHFGQ